jgi:hypothetical protein
MTHRSVLCFVLSIGLIPGLKAQADGSGCGGRPNRRHPGSEWRIEDLHSSCWDQASAVTEA